MTILSHELIDITERLSVKTGAVVLSDNKKSHGFPNCSEQDERESVSAVFVFL